MVGDGGGVTAGGIGDATNAMGNFSFEVTLGYRRLEKPRRSRQRVTDDM